MGAVKITAADKWFSQAIRQRARWTCERCGSQCPPDKRMGLHCSHYHGRGKHGTRYDPLNCSALCYGCHRYLGSHPAMHRQWMLDRIGPLLMDVLQERANDQTLGRLMKREGREIAAHYREQARRMVAQDSDFLEAYA